MGGGAARRAVVVALAVVAVLAGVASAAVYEVGDKIGWTILGNPDYAAWAASKKIREGDTVVFKYNKQFHNVLAVTKAGYTSCDTSKPIATWTTGNDSVVLNTAGHHYFICGVPGHCAGGQKVDILVGSSAASSPAPTPAPSSGGAPAPSAAPSTVAARSVAAAVLAAAVLA